MGIIIWFIVALILGVIELMSTTFILLWVAIAAAVTGLISLFAHSFELQLLVFVVLSIILLLLTRPLVKRWRNAGTSRFKSSVEELVGEQGIVVTRGVGEKAGVVRVGTEVWSARCEDSEEPLDRGERVVVIAVKSSQLIVRKTTQAT